MPGGIEALGGLPAKRIHCAVQSRRVHPRPVGEIGVDIYVIPEIGIRRAVRIGVRGADEGEVNVRALWTSPGSDVSDGLSWSDGLTVLHETLREVRVVSKERLAGVCPYRRRIGFPHLGLVWCALSATEPTDVAVTRASSDDLAPTQREEGRALREIEVVAELVEASCGDFDVRAS